MGSVELRALGSGATVNSPATSIGNSSGNSSVLTVPEVACLLRCSKAHVHNLINGKVPEVEALPSIWLGRRRLVRRESLFQWLEAQERR